MNEILHYPEIVKMCLDEGLTCKRFIKFTFMIELLVSDDDDTVMTLWCWRREIGKNWLIAFPIRHQHRLSRKWACYGTGSNQITSFKLSHLCLFYWYSIFHPSSCLYPNQMGREVKEENVLSGINPICHLDTMFCRNENSDYSPMIS